MAYASPGGMSPLPIGRSRADGGHGRFHRRDSVADATGELSDHLNHSLTTLRQIWDDVGLSDAQRGARVSSVYLHLKTLLNEMVEEETRMRDEMKRRIHDYRVGCSTLSRELAIPDEKIQADDVSMVSREEFFRKRLEELTLVREERITTRDRQSARDKELCSFMDTEMYYLSGSVVPTAEQLADQQQHIQAMEYLLAERKEEFRERKRRIQSLMRKMKHVPQGEFEDAVVSQPEEDFRLTADNLIKLRDLADRVEEGYKEHLASLGPKIAEAAKELEEWWGKCHVPEADRHNVPPLSEETINEETLEAFKTEIARWTEFYNERQSVLNKLNDWEALWQEKVKWEAREADPARYTNRGGDLQRELKRQKLVESSLLPRAEQELKEVCDTWMRQRPGKPIRIQGLHPLDYVSRIREEYFETKEAQKQNKKKEQQKQLINETRYGTPITKRVASPRKNFGQGVPLSPGMRSQSHKDLSTVRHHPYGVSTALRTPVSKPPGLPMGSSSRKTPGGWQRAAAAGAGKTTTTPISSHPYSQRPPLPSSASASKMSKYASQGHLPLVEVQDPQRHQHQHVIPISLHSSPFQGRTPTPSKNENQQTLMTIDSIDSYRHFANTLHSRGEEENMVSSFIGGKPGTSSD